ncbi:MAG TPA: tyrosine-type recombinase/integrase [Kiritimatiellia bacterium]|nr:tyrosine-type recombinase/integrase [Kiritimatiellia bacterium]HMP00586.1 tyrosine-type recombinase/integrase [Kiritimatiellia bacterium]HMP00821.1 tyrosine-type recombinase/integrase [Kiritimatiellia bacterium]
MDGRARCPAEMPLFADASGRNALSTRWIQVLVREIAKRAGLQKIVLPVTLRHSYAVHFLQDGGTIRELQENLDHRLLETTARYLNLVDLSEKPPPDNPAPTPPPAKPFWRELTDRFTRRIKGIRLFMSSA